MKWRFFTLYYRGVSYYDTYSIYLCSLSALAVFCNKNSIFDVFGVETFVDEMFHILCTMFTKFVFINKICVIYSSFYKHLSLKTTENVKNKFYNLQNAELIIILPR